MLSGYPWGGRPVKWSKRPGSHVLGHAIHNLAHFCGTWRCLYLPAPFFDLLRCRALNLLRVIKVMSFNLKKPLRLLDEPYSASVRLAGSMADINKNKLMLVPSLSKLICRDVPANQGETPGERDCRDVLQPPVPLGRGLRSDVEQAPAHA